MMATGRCQSCGAGLPAGNAFCPHCGSPAAAAQPQAAPPQPQQAPWPPQQAAAPAVQAAMPAPQAAMPQTQAMQATATTPVGGIAVARTVGMDAQAMPQPVAAAIAQPAAAQAAAAAAGPAAARPRRAPAMTAMAGVGLNMAKIFNTAFGAPFPGWRAELSEPVGPSTGGGKQALQPITLVAPTGERLAVGRVDAVRRVAHLRDHQLVNSMHQERFGRPMALNSQDFNRWVEAVRGYLNTSGLQVSYDKPDATLERAPDSGGSAIILWIALFITAAALIAVIVWYLTR